MKVLLFISTKGAGITEPGDPYLSRFLDIYSNILLRPVVHPHLLGRYFNACNATDNHNRMWQSDLALDKYLVTQSGYFILSTTVVLGMGITDGSSYNVMVLQREMWTRKFQHWITTTGRFMTASIIPFCLILVAHI